MPPCDLCKSRPIAEVVALGGRSDRRIRLCLICAQRQRAHELDPHELLALDRGAASRVGRCEWCENAPPTTQAQVLAWGERRLTFQLCARCAAEAHSADKAEVLRPRTALEGDQDEMDPGYERALKIARRRRSMRLID